MDELWTCLNIMCSVYVFGPSAGGICPGCQLDGIKMTREQTTAFTPIYREVQTG